VRVVTSLGQPVDRQHVRRHNLSLVLRQVSSPGAHSRASVAGATGLTRATVSSLVDDLIRRGLVKEVGLADERRMGRPATMLEPDGSRVVAIGIEIDVGALYVVAIDLAGRVVHQRRRVLGGSLEFDPLLSRLVEEIRVATRRVEAEGGRVAGLSVAVPGIADVGRGLVVRAPNLGWRNVPLRDRLVARLGADVPIVVDNEANLGALAELRTPQMAGVGHLVYLLAVSGVGAGVVIDGAVFRGASGAAGEFGHTTVKPDGAPCACGSRGCWETVIGLRALLQATVPDLADALLADTRRSLEQKVQAVIDRAKVGDRTALAGLRSFGRWLGLGLANVIDTCNPEVIVLAGFLPAISPWVMPAAMNAVHANVLPESVASCRVVSTTLGFTAGARGGAMLAIDHVLADPTSIALL
jgi:predicted NBD/HSP70 family sugar kinase